MPWRQSPIDADSRPAALTNTGGVTPGNGVFEFNYYAAGIGYTVAPGLKFYGELFYYNDYNTHILSTASNSGGTLNFATVSSAFQYGCPDGLRLSKPNSF